VVAPGCIFFAAAVLFGAMTAAMPQQAGGTKAGVLTCKTSASLGLIVDSHQKLRCSFSPDNGPPENYEGHVNRLGLDLGIKAAGARDGMGRVCPDNWPASRRPGRYLCRREREAPPTDSVLAVMPSLPVRIVPLRCSHSRSKARSASI